jgi:hypothetical protein
VPAVLNGELPLSAPTGHPVRGWSQLEKDELDRALRKLAALESKGFASNDPNSTQALVFLDEKAPPSVGLLLYARLNFKLRYLRLNLV